MTKVKSTSTKMNQSWKYKDLNEYFENIRTKINENKKIWGPK